MRHKRILLLGQRPLAVQAADTLHIAAGLEYILLYSKVPKTVGGGELGRYQVDFSAPESQWQALAQELQRYGPFQAVIPLGEPQVLSAGWLTQTLRPHLGIVPELAWRCTHKGVMKDFMQAAGLPLTQYCQAGTPAEQLSELGFPQVHKAVLGSGSRGLQIYHAPEQLPAVLPQGWLAERFVVGEEFSVESLVQNGEIRFVNITRYTVQKWENLVPADFGPERKAQIEDFNRAVIAALKISQGLTHLELFQTERGLLFGEIALRPPGGHIMELLTLAYGFDAWEAYLRVMTGLPLAPLPREAQVFSAVRMLHPGAGEVVVAEGFEQAAKHPQAVQVKLKTRLGKVLSAREGVGQEAAFLIAQGATAPSALSALAEMRAQVDLQVKSSERPPFQKVLVACDKFKGSLTSAEVNQALVEGLQQGAGLEVQTLAVADGGEGLIAALQQVWPLQLLRRPCRDPLGRVRQGLLAQHPETGAVFLESSEATGLHLLSPQERNPAQTQSAGVGDLIRTAVEDLQATAIYLGLGSSGTVDGGLGCLSALGFIFRDAAGQVLPGTSASLAEVAQIEAPECEWPPLILISDVFNPPLGPRGGVRVYAPQKGADAAMVEHLEAGMAQWVKALETYTGTRLSDFPGGGAAGCLSLGLVALLGARLQAGAPWLLEQIGLREKLDWADLVITGEGGFDASSLEGKITGEIVQQAQEAGKPVRLVCGHNACATLPEGLLTVQALVDLDPRAAGDPELSRRLLRELGTKMAHF